MTRRSAEAELKELTRRRPDLEALLPDLLAELWKASDRAFALVWSSVVEDNLRRRLLKSMRDLPSDVQDQLFEGYGPLASFSARTKLSYALSLIGPKTRANLDRIRAVRNAFAHTGTSLSFATPQVANVCRLLDISDLTDEPKNEVKRLYETACFQIAGRLHNQVRGTEPSSLP